MKESTKRSLLVASIILSLVPAFVLLPFPASTTFASVTLWFADTLGYVGIVLFLWMYILGAKSITGLVFKDLSPVLSIHKWLGKYGVFAIFAHPLLVTFSYGESLLYSFVLQLGTLFERHVTLGRIAFWLTLLTWITSALLRDRIAFRPWKYLHYLAYICVPFALLHVPDVGSYFMSQTAVKVYFAGLVLAFFAVTLLRLRGFLNLDKTEYEVVQHTKFNETDFVIILRPLRSRFVKPRRGQYVYIKLGFVSEDHPFSVLRYDETTHEITVAYRTYGSYTKVMCRLHPGAKVNVGGPYGEFMSDIETVGPVVYISGGIGVTPFLDQITKDAGTREQWLFAANKDHLAAKVALSVQPILKERYVGIYSQERKVAASEEQGRLNAAMLTKYLKNPSDYTYYLCGPKQMMKDMRVMLENLGVSSRKIETEKFEW